jgi:hypothetical protein
MECFIFRWRLASLLGYTTKTDLCLWALLLCMFVCHVVPIPVSSIVSLWMYPPWNRPYGFLFK